MSCSGRVEVHGAIATLGIRDHTTRSYQEAATVLVSRFKLPMTLERVNPQDMDGSTHSTGIGSQCHLTISKLVSILNMALLNTGRSHKALWATSP